MNHLLELGVVYTEIQAMKFCMVKVAFEQHIIDRGIEESERKRTWYWNNKLKLSRKMYS